MNTAATFKKGNGHQAALSPQHKITALENAVDLISHLVKVARDNGRPYWLIVAALRTQMHLIRELSATRQP